MEPAGKPRKFSLTPSDTLSESVGSPLSPRCSITVADEAAPPPEAERDFFAHLYGGELAGMDAGGAVPEEYYNYLQAWYRAQAGILSADGKSDSAPSLHANVPVVVAGGGGGPSASVTALAAAAQPPAASLQPPAAAGGHQGVFIPVSALQSLRASLPAHLPQLTSGTRARPTTGYDTRVASSSVQQQPAAQSHCYAAQSSSLCSIVMQSSLFSHCVCGRSVCVSTFLVQT